MSTVQYFEKGSMIALVLFFAFKIALAIHGLLWLYMNCMVAFSISVKTSH
jgi:hypothetical protein